ncbi:hypothetical protein NLX83_15690 [Allokutzneria sp. A3M-2-11 16]|uniref:hypothetical protein n=1 Tax=Allokutzneria sp. A3M-2-11 16 TaxID=2962043 RepID=UPI0020B84716|nr:hypothetical protein [Allokutzneria sp. A3M-2-11 16]MCP3800710.1 hypothetical protein [Allokutzneria sp. A3M-2-11 16]
MTASLYLDSDYVATTEDESRVALEFGGDLPGYRCARCGADLDDTGDGFSGADGDTLCPDYENEDGDPDDGPHEPQAIALAWANSATIVTNEAEDSITVLISVGDPRGAFAFTVRRVPDDAPSHGGALILHTPYPGESLPHRPLSELHPGTYLIS